MRPPVEESKTFSEIVDDAAERRKRLRKLILLVILISVGIHVVGGLGAGVWVIARYLAQPKAQFVVQKQVNLKPEDRQHRMAMDELSSLRPKPVFNNRIQSLRPSKLALPELPRVPTDTLVPIDTTALVTDAVEGTGMTGQGNGTGGGFFGGAGNPGNGLLEGTLYDLKAKENGTPSEIGATTDSYDHGATMAYIKAVSRLVNSGARDSAMRSYFKVPKKLYLGQLAVPMIEAGDAPRAFESNIKPRHWVIVYRGLVSPPKDGTYRFAGSADDVLIVRFNNRVVLEGSLGPTRVTDWESRDPASVRGGWGEEFGNPANHVNYGDWITMKAGQFYPIEIIVGEVPGSGFYANLHIQEKDATYVKGPDGKPILPLFRLQVNLPGADRPVRSVAPDGPVFKAITNRQGPGGSGLP